MYIEISEPVQKYFNNLLSQRGENTNIRIFVTDPGTAFAECGVAYCTPEDEEDDDYKLYYQGFYVVVDQHSWPFLEQAKIEFCEDENGKSLALKAPRAKGIPPAEDASLEERVNYLIKTTINPQLASHGGNIQLVTIEDSYAILIFGGGCNGCSMLDITLKEGVEKQIVEAFPGEIIGVKDSTEHVRGFHSYY